ncbi:MAG: flavin reductase family protein [Thaumarchaeota archaeon]|nr:flavin reductase family protein [Nitrososphaerota archaeon]
MNKKVIQSAQRLFMTGVSFITSYGPNGQNVMAAEWTMQISYEPMLIAVFIHEGSSTLENIRKTKQFGINVASEKQATLISIAGGYSRKEIDKLSINNSFQLLKSKKTKIPLIANCLINAECDLTMIKKIGDHIMVVGKVVSIRYNDTEKPLVYHRNRYFSIGPSIEPARDKIIINKNIFDSFLVPNKNKFILKCVGVLIRTKNKILILENTTQKSVLNIPYIQPKKGQNNKTALEKYLQSIKLDITLKNKPTLKRLIVKNKDGIQRINFVLFEGKLENKSGFFSWQTIKTDSFLKSLTR